MTSHFAEAREGLVSNATPGFSRGTLAEGTKNDAAPVVGDRQRPLDALGKDGEPVAFYEFINTPFIDRIPDRTAYSFRVGVSLVTFGET